MYQVIPKLILSRKLKNIIKDSSKFDPIDLIVLDFHPIELARQITLKDQSIFREISLEELFEENYQDEIKSPNLHKFQSEFNRITSWVCTEIVMVPVLKKRIKVLSQFIILCEVDTLSYLISEINRTSKL